MRTEFVLNEAKAKRKRCGSKQFKPSDSSETEAKRTVLVLGPFSRPFQALSQHVVVQCTSIFMASTALALMESRSTLTAFTNTLMASISTSTAYTLALLWAREALSRPLQELSGVLQSHKYNIQLTQYKTLHFSEGP
jgi:hypothetical protein